MKRELHFEFSGMNRRKFFKTGVLMGIPPAAALLNACKEKTAEEITPPEDLMREHGLLSRILLIYDNCNRRLTNHITFDFNVLNSSAQIIRDFIENYHEKQEEDFVFSHFERKNKFPDLVKTLRAQHLAGRTLTDLILNYGKLMENVISEEQRQKIINLLDAFNRMYRPHKAREDTILFPEIRNVVSEREFEEMGEKFEDREHELFGEKGYEKMVEKVDALERLVAIEELDQFTPKNLI